MIEKMLRWRDALQLRVLAECRGPVVSAYDLGVQLAHLVHEGHYQGRPLSLPGQGLNARMWYEARTELERRGVVLQERWLPKGYYLTAAGKTADPIEILCAIDPFGYAAYFSAMSIHGLSDRLPRIVYFVTPEPGRWKQLAREKMTRDLGDARPDDSENTLPPLRHTSVPKIHGNVIQTIRTKETGGWRHLREERIRVATLGRTFLHMIQKPDYCGGLAHVIDVYREHAPSNLAVILSELSQHGTDIDRVRVGYILEERCGVSDRRLDDWLRYVARGGSRKLEVSAEYAPVFSERWSLSIND